jgi:tetratricopeptide (TPR) repeat protein
MRQAIASCVAIVVVASAVEAQTVQYRAMNGVQHMSQVDTGTVARAMAARRADPGNPDLILALGLAQAGVRQYREAIATFSDGIRIAPQNVVLYRWRGHRYLSTGQFSKSLADLTRGFALDSMNYDVLYHLGAVRFIRGDFTAAADAFRRAQPLAPNVNEFAGATDWLWMSLSRAGRGAEATRALGLTADTLKVTTATAYMQRLRLYRGLTTAEQAITPADTAAVQRSTLSYGVGNWYLTRGDTVSAKQWFQRAVDAAGWPAFGFLAAEQELKRLR